MAVIKVWHCIAPNLNHQTVKEFKSCTESLDAELGTFGIFSFFSLIKNDFLNFYQVNLTGSGLLNRTGAEIGY